MKLNEKFITHISGDEHIMVSAGGTKFNGLVRSNKTAGDIIECLKKDVTKDEIVNFLLNKYDADINIIETDVDNIISELRNIGAIDE